MSSVEPSSASRPLRVAGLAALGVAGVALVLGVVSLATDSGSEGNSADPPAASSETSAPGAEPSTQPPTTAPATTSPAAQPTSAQPTTAPPATTVPPTTTAPPQEPVTTTPKPPAGPPQPSSGIRVYNNSNIKGLAERAAEDLRGAGWTVDTVDNYSSGIIPTTTAFYRPGTDEQAAAQALAKAFHIRAEPRFDGIRDAAPGLIVIVTKEYKPNTK